MANVYGLTIPVPSYSSAPVYASYTLDATGEKAAFVLAAPKTGSIRKLSFRTNTVTTPTDTDLRLESVSATTGNPSGTLFGTNTNVTVASASITANSWITGTLTADASVTKGELVAIVIAPSGSPNYTVAIASVINLAERLPYPALYTTSWAKNSASAGCVCAFEYSDGSYAFTPWVFPYSAFTTHSSISTSSTPDEIALKFKMAAPVRVCGAWLLADLDGNADIVLYDSDGSTALQTVSLDKDQRAVTSAGMLYITFPASQSLSANTYYRLAYKPSTVTGGAVYSGDVASAAIFDQMEGGQNFHYSQRTDAGAWSDTTTRRPFMGLILDGIDDGAGSGGGGVAWIS